MSEIVVREHARLTTSPLEAVTPDRAQISPTAFDWLCELSGRLRQSGAALVELDGRRWLKLDNYVGVVETPCGTRIEILPKHTEDGADLADSRKLLKRMIASALDLPVRSADVASLQLFNAPLSEWVMGQFLAALDHLVKRGVRSDYQRVEATERYLHGQLDVVRQLRQSPGRQHLFQIRHDVFVPDRAENRLLKCALERVCKTTQTPGNWRLAHELRSLLHEIPASRDIEADFRQWRTDRLMAHYAPLKPWCELILYRQMPWSLRGDWHGISMLFPMERLFERYVAASLRRTLAPRTKLVEQAARHSLCEHLDRPMFQLRPDLLLQQEGRQWVLDAKWKLIDAARPSDNYGLSQSDFYQLFAYGMKYLGGVGEMALIYPRHARFAAPLVPFDYSPTLRLWVLPFDLEMQCLVDNELTALPLRNPYGITAFAETTTQV